MIEADPLLGKPLANYPSNREQPLFLSGIIGLSAAVILNFTLANVESWWGPTLTILLMGSLVLALAWYVIHVWNREVILYERGFSYREGSTTVYFLYSEVKSVRQRAQRVTYFGGIVRRNAYKVIVNTIRDELITLTNVYRRIDELGMRLERQFNITRRPVVDELLSRGEKVPFGESLSLSDQGIIMGERLLPWHEYAGYRAQKGKFIVLTAPETEWASVPLDEVDNLLLLLDIIRERTVKENPS